MGKISGIQSSAVSVSFSFLGRGTISRKQFYCVQLNEWRCYFLNQLAHMFDWAPQSSTHIWIGRRTQLSRLALFFLYIFFYSEG